MSTREAEVKKLVEAYLPGDSPSIEVGGILLDESLLPNASVHILLKILNRHGLIAGATGTGKTKTIQLLSEALSINGVPSLVMDMKGDLSGLSQKGELTEQIQSRSEKLSLPFDPKEYWVEFLSFGKEKGVAIRTTISALGALLLAKILSLSEAQASVTTVLLHYANQQSMPVVGLDDLKALLKYAEGEAKEAIELEYGKISSSSVKSIIRKIIELESQGGSELFGEPSFDVADLTRVSKEGEGIISIFRLMTLQDKPTVFSTLMLGLLTDIYQHFPEVGDLDKPKLVLFIDEAHLLFDNASEVLLERLESMVKLIRSKGVGLIFCTQSPRDIPEGILSQLGLKIQHSLRAFTAKDREAIKRMAKNFPSSELIDTEKALTSLGIGSALISSLDKKGQPTPLATVFLSPPRSRMGVISEKELNTLTMTSDLVKKYETVLDNKSAAEMVKERMSSFPKEKQSEKELSKHHQKKEGKAKRISALKVIKMLGDILIKGLNILTKLLRVLKK
jgi:hypothetical protein